jgi:hypothetical protein
MGYWTRGPKPRCGLPAVGASPVRRVSAHTGHGPMARTTSTAIPSPCAAGRPEPGLTKRQAAVCLLQPPPGGPVKGGSKRQTHDQAEPHCAAKQTVGRQASPRGRRRGERLVPRLPRWRKLNPHAPLDVIGTDTVLDLQSGDTDVAIRYTRSAPTDGIAKEFLSRGRRHGPCVDGSGLSRILSTLQRWSVQP